MLIPNEELAELPAVVSPVPEQILTGHWRVTLNPSVDSDDLSLPGSPYFGFTGILALGDEHRLCFSRSGDNLRLDVLDAEGTHAGGLLAWPDSPLPTIVIDVDVPNATIAVTAAGVTFGGGWDSIEGATATKVLTEWTWEGTDSSWGGIGGNFNFLGTISDVQEVT